SMMLRLLLLLIPVVAQAADDWREIYVGENNLMYWEDSVYIRASWKSAGEYASPRVPKLNVTQIRCTRKTMSCLEAVAQVDRLRKSDPESRPHMMVYTITYEIQAWDGEALTARRTNPGGEPIDDVLTIDMPRGRVQKVWKDRPGS